MARMPPAVLTFAGKYGSRVQLDAGPTLLGCLLLAGGGEAAWHCWVTFVHPLPFQLL